MFCRNCGKELSDEAFMCPDCGTPTTNSNKHAPNNQISTCSVKGYLSTLGFFFSLAALAIAGIFVGLNCCYDITVIYSISYSNMTFEESKYAYNVAILGIILILIGLVSLIFSCFGLFRGGNQQTRTQTNYAIAGTVISCFVFVMLILSCSICATAF